MQTTQPAVVSNECLFYFVSVSFVAYRSKYFRNRKVFGDWDLRVEQVIRILIFYLYILGLRKLTIN